MKLIISNSFEKKYLSSFLGRYFSFDEFSKNILSKRKDIHLKFPYLKIKVKILGVDFRGVILVQEDKYIIPLIFCLKKDKNCGENIIWENFEKEILFMERKVLEDIEAINYKIF